MDGWMDERCFRPLLCTVKAELGWGQPGLMRWNWDEALPQSCINRSPSTQQPTALPSELAAAPSPGWKKAAFDLLVFACHLTPPSPFFYPSFLNCALFKWTLSISCIALVWPQLQTDHSGGLFNFTSLLYLRLIWWIHAIWPFTWVHVLETSEIRIDFFPWLCCIHNGLIVCWWNNRCMPQMWFPGSSIYFVQNNCFCLPEIIVTHQPQLVLKFPKLSTAMSLVHVQN